MVQRLAFESARCCAAGLYQAGPKNLYFRPKALAGWLLNAIFQAGVMFVMVMFATQATYSDRSSGTTFSHWEVHRPFTLFHICVLRHACTVLLR